MCQLVTIEANDGSKVAVAEYKADHISKIIELASLCPRIDYIILFGSALSDKCTIESDIDLAIISNVSTSKLFRDSSYDRFISYVYQINKEQEYDLIQFSSLEALQKSKKRVSRDILSEGKMIYVRSGA